MRTWFKVLLPLLLLLTLPSQVRAQFTFTTNNGTITIVYPSCVSGALTIPDTINGYPVTSIGTNAFYDCTNLTNVTLGTNVTSIGDYAFCMCFRLSSLIIPNSVTGIGDWAFADCGLSSVTIGTNVTEIGNSAFLDCSILANITIPNSVTSIGDGAFAYCSSLTNITIGSGVTNIGDGTFEFCISLTSVTIPDSVTSIGGGLFEFCTSLTTIIVGISTTNIGTLAFYHCPDLTGVYFKGNAPTAVQPLFNGDYNVTVYYLPGTSGWDNWVSPPAAVLWNPAIATTDGTFGVLSNQFGFTITGTTNIPIVVEASTNLQGASWTSLQSCTLTNGSIYFSDPQWTNYATRFYRIRSP